ncbi:MAG: hypothetical protein J6X11_00020 [Treponema sp.]|nr:hypothetical protein [Treponema sp.]
MKKSLCLLFLVFAFSALWAQNSGRKVTLSGLVEEMAACSHESVKVLSTKHVGGKVYRILPSLVIEKCGDKVLKSEDDLFGDFSNDFKCSYFVEIKENLLLLYHASDKDAFACECKEIEPEATFFIEFKESRLGERLFFFGSSKEGKSVDGYVDEANKDGSLCIYGKDGIDLYLLFEYASIN